MSCYDSHKIKNFQKNSIVKDICCNTLQHQLHIATCKTHDE